MRRSLLAILLGLIASAACNNAFGSEDSNALMSDAIDPNARSAKAFIITCEDMIDDGLFQSIKRRAQIAIDNGADYIIFQMSTYGGLVISADDIAKFIIHDIEKPIKTVAYVKTEAISAGAFIAVSCSDIVMKKNTTIGDCAPITMGGESLGEVEREKTETFIRAAFRRAAQANGHPEALIEAMVTHSLQVYWVKNLQTGQMEFFEDDNLPTDPNEYDLDNKKLIVNDEQILTLTSNQSLEYGLASAVVDDLDDMLSFFEKRDNVTFDSDVVLLETNWSEEMVRWLYSPTVMGILVMLGALGIYIEMKTPGIGLPALLAVICFGVLLLSKYFIGMANWIEIAIFIIGLLLMAIEIFVLPGFGIAGGLGILCIFAGLFGMLVKNAPDEIPWPTTEYDWQIFSDGAIGLIAGFGSFIILAAILNHFLPKVPFARGLFLDPANTDAALAAKISSSAPSDSSTAVRIGDKGIVISMLRPAGKAKFNDTIVDVVTWGDFINTDTEIVIIQIAGNRVTVKPVNQN